MGEEATQWESILSNEHECANGESDESPTAGYHEGVVAVAACVAVYEGGGCAEEGGDGEVYGYERVRGGGGGVCGRGGGAVVGCFFFLDFFSCSPWFTVLSPPFYSFLDICVWRDIC